MRVLIASLIYSGLLTGPLSADEAETGIQIKLSSVLVNDQEKALQFYTENLGFVKQTVIHMGAYRWLTVASPAGSEEIELALEPTGFPPAKTYQKALYNAGIPYTAFRG